MPLSSWLEPFLLFAVYALADTLNVGPGGTCCPANATVQLQALYFSQVFFARATIDPFDLNEKLTISAFPSTVVASHTVTSTIWDALPPGCSRVPTSSALVIQSTSSASTSSTEPSQPSHAASSTVSTSTAPTPEPSTLSQTFFLAFNTNPAPNAPRARGITQRQTQQIQPANESSPIVFINLIKDAGVGNGVTNVPPEQCNEATAFTLQDGLLFRVDTKTAIGKQQGVTEALIETMNSLSRDVVNTTFALSDSLLTWTAADGLGSANFFACPEGVVAGFPTISRIGCTQIQLFAFKINECSPQTSSTSRTVPSTSGPSTPSTSMSGSASLSTTSSTPSASASATTVNISISSTLRSSTATSTHTASAATIPVSTPSSSMTSTNIGPTPSQGPSTTSVSSVSTTTTTTSTTSPLTTTTTTTATATTTTTTTTPPVCNFAFSFCPNAVQLAAATIAVIQCPLMPGLLCTVAELRSLIPILLQSNPNIESVVLGDNQVLGLASTAQQVQALAMSGVLTAICPANLQVNALLSDAACPITLGPTTSSTTTSVTPTPSAPSQQCGVVVQLCVGQTLASLSLAEVECSQPIPALCTLSQLRSDVANACAAIPGGCDVVGRIGTAPNVLGAKGLVGTQSLTQIQAAVAAFANCQPSSNLLTLGDPSCPGL